MSVEKVAIGSVCVGGTCAVGYGAYEFSRAKDLRGLLFDQEPFTEEEPQSTWEGLVTKYEEDSAANKFDDFTLQAVSGDQNKSKADQLKDKCLEALKTPVSDESAIQSLTEPAKSWCTKKSTNFTSLPKASAPTVQVTSVGAGTGGS